MFGLDDLRNFFALWISLFGVIGIAINIILRQKRLRLQDTLIHQQEKQGRDNRFAKSMELLGHESESVRLGATYNLSFLTKEYPHEYGDAVFTLLCSHIRMVTGSLDYQNKFKEESSPEIQTILQLFRDPDFGKDETYFIDLEKAYLQGADLMDTNLNWAHLNGANLSKAHLCGINLGSADLFGTNLEGAYLEEARLKGANLKGAYLKGANLKGAYLAGVDLTDVDLSQAFLN